MFQVATDKVGQWFSTLVQDGSSNGLVDVSHCLMKCFQ